jgi:transcriptional regulator with XRE-family HTH domain
MSEVIKQFEYEEQVFVRLGKAIRLRRKELKLTQREFAELSGLHRTYLSNVEQGSRNLSVLTLMRIAGALKTSSIALLTAAETLPEQGG